MILDNRQAIPDIVISRHGVPNIHSNDYTESNDIFDQRGNGVRKEIQNAVAVTSMAPIASPKHVFATGNNNGSPRRAPKNGNIYVGEGNTFNFSELNAQQGDVCQKPLYNRSPPQRHCGKDVRSNIPLPKTQTNGKIYGKHHHFNIGEHGLKRNTTAACVSHCKNVPNNSHLSQFSKKPYSKLASTNNVSTKSQSDLNATSKLTANNADANKLNSRCNYSPRKTATRPHENLSGFQRTVKACNRFPTHHEPNIKCSKNLVPTKLGNQQNMVAEENIFHSSADKELIMSTDSLTKISEVPVGQYSDNWQSVEWNRANVNHSFYMDTDKSEEDNNKVLVSNPSRSLSTGTNCFGDKHNKLSSMDDIRDISFDSDEIKLLTDDDCSSTECSSTYECKMAVVNCNGQNYLTKLLLSDDDIHGLKIVGRIGIASHGMSLENPEISGQMLYTDLRRDIQPETSSSLSSQGTDSEFEHEAADYQWLLDYEYRENYSRDSLAPTKDGSLRVSILQTAENAGDFSYEAISRNLDANLAEIDMDDFRSEHIHQILSLPSADNDYEDENESKLEEDYQNERDGNQANSCEDAYYPENVCDLRLRENAEEIREQEDAKESSCCRYLGCTEEEDADCSGVSEEISLYKSGPLFSPLREPIPPSFSVDSLDSGSMHEDLILTCQANKDNYTIAFEGSFIHNSSNSDYRDTGTSDSGESATWSTENLEDHIPASDMTHSDQPYTTWSRVSRRLSQTPESDPNCSAIKHDTTAVPKQNAAKDHCLRQREKQRTNGSKSSSMPNLMRKSLMRKSLEASGQCMKVYDLQKSLRSTSHLSQSRMDANHFSLLRLFMKQKSLRKDGISRSSSFTDRSNDGCYSSSENHSTNNESSDWPMNSQSETDLERSSSPVQNCFRCAKGNNQNHAVDVLRECDGTSLHTDNRTRAERIERLNNNNNTITHHIDNVTLHLNSIENLNSFDDSLRDAITCSKPPMTSPIREEPEGMEMSINQETFTISKSEVPAAWNGLEESSKDSSNSESNIMLSKGSSGSTTSEGKLETSGQQVKVSYKREVLKQNLQNCKSEPPGRHSASKEKTAPSKRVEERKRVANLRETKPKPRPRLTKEFSDQCLQTSNLKSSGTINTSKIFDQKEVYVYYPNYALPDLKFLQDKKYSLDTKIFLVPQHYSMTDGRRATKGHTSRSGRPLSHNDITKLKQDNFSHVEDWESLNFLLPKELKEMLKDNSECMETLKPSFCRPTKSSRRPVSTDFSPQRTFNESKGSSASINSTQPSSGYRGSSTLLNESDPEDVTISGNAARCLNYPRRLRPNSSDDVTKVNETNPLPKGVLRKCSTIKGSKRNSCDIDNKIRMREELLKRRSLPEFDERKENIFCNKIPTNKVNLKETKSTHCSCLSHCTGFCAAGLRSKNIIDPVILPKTRAPGTASATEMKNLKTRVSSTQLYAATAKNNKPDMHKTMGGQRPCELSIKGNEAYHCSSKLRDKSSAKFSHQPLEDLPPMVYDLGEKKTLVISVRSAVEKLVSYFQLATPREKQQLGNAPNCVEVAQLVLNKLCPAVYALLSDGLLPSLHSLFGKITNSVWKVVETTSQLGPSTKALHDLVMTLNGEECLTEGPIKCNAFIFGLLNLRSLDAWLSYLRTREVALQKHYHPESFLYLANTAMRSLFDDLILALRPLALLPFQLDIMFEYKALHASLIKMEERFFMASRREASHETEAGSVFDNLVIAKESKEFRNVAAQQDRIRAFVKAINPQQVEIRRDRSNSPRPRSCYEGESANQEAHDSLRKRWSGVQLGSKLVTALDKLLNEAADSSSQDYTDSIDNVKCKDSHPGELRLGDSQRKCENNCENSASDKDTDNEKFTNSKYPQKNGPRTESEGDRFRRLQLKWEQMAIHPLRHQNSHAANSISPGCTSRSRIPRPVSITSPQRPYKPFEPIMPLGKEKPKPTPRRSLKDKIAGTDIAVRHVVKPRVKSRKSPSVSADNSRASSVPDRGVDNIAPLARYDAYRRNAASRSSSQGREVIGNFRYVETLHHRMATDNGHLSFNKGDLLSVVIDVDEKFILCCLNDRKGIVPRSSVIPFNP